LDKLDNFKIKKSKKILIIILSTVFIILYILTWFLVVSPVFPHKDKKETKSELSRDEYIKINEITFDVPLEFEAFYDEKNAIFNYKEDDNLSCMLSVSQNIPEYHIYEWFKRQIRYYNVNIDYNSKFVQNGITIYQYEYDKDPTRTEYYYALASNNKYYLFNYIIFDGLKGDRENLDSSICYSSREKIISSIKLKE